MSISVTYPGRPAPPWTPPRCSFARHACHPCHPHLHPRQSYHLRPRRRSHRRLRPGPRPSRLLDSEGSLHGGSLWKQ